MNNNKTRAALLGLLYATLAVAAAIVVAPTAIAHTGCQSTTPDGCGPCGPGEDHSHYVSYSSRQVMWCYYEEPDPEDPCEGLDFVADPDPCQLIGLSPP